VPIGGKQMISFMDDFNMPAKDTFGSQPPLELIKLWLDYGFWYDRLKQTIKFVRVSIKTWQLARPGLVAQSQLDKVINSSLEIYKLYLLDRNLSFG